MRHIIFFGVAATLVLTGCHHHGAQSEAQPATAPFSNSPPELPPVAEIFAIEANKFIVGGLIMNAAELEHFISILPQETEVVFISRDDGLSLPAVKQMLDKRGLDYRLHQQVQK